MLVLLLQHLYALFLIPFYVVYNSIKALIPYKIRAKSVKNEIVLVTGGGQLFNLYIQSGAQIKVRYFFPMTQVVVSVKALPRDWRNLVVFWFCGMLTRHPMNRLQRR